MSHQKSIQTTLLRASAGQGGAQTPDQGSPISIVSPSPGRGGGEGPGSRADLSAGQLSHLGSSHEPLQCSAEPPNQLGSERLRKSFQPPPYACPLPTPNTSGTKPLELAPAPPMDPEVTSQRPPPQSLPQLPSTTKERRY